MTSPRRWIVRIGVSVSVIGVAYALYAVAARYAPPRVEPNAEAPMFSAVTLDKVPQLRSIADYRGSPVLLNVWATWCDPCRDEMPSMQLLYDAYRERGLRVVAVSIDDEGSDPLIREFVAEHHLTFDVLHDRKSEIMPGYQVRGVPQSFLISASGRILATRFVTDWSSQENRQLVERLLFAARDSSSTPPTPR